MLEVNSSYKRDPELNKDEDIRMEVSREKHWMDVADDGEDKSKSHALRWDFYTREK